MSERAALTAIPEPEDLDVMIGQIVSDDPPTRFFGIQSLFERLYIDVEMTYARLVHTKAYDVILDNLTNDQLPDLQYKCADILTFLLSGCEKPDTLTKGGMCLPLVKLLGSRAADRTRETACWALFFIVWESAEWRDQTLVCGLLPALTAVWDSKPCTDVLVATLVLLKNLFHDREPRVNFEVVKDLLPYMSGLLDHLILDSEFVHEVVLALANLVDGSEPRVRLLLLQEDLVQRLHSFLGSRNDSLLRAVLCVFCNISSAVTPLPSCALADDVLKKMRVLLDHPDQKIRRQVLLFVSSLSKGPDSHRQQIVDAGFLPGLP